MATISQIKTKRSVHSVRRRFLFACFLIILIAFLTVGISLMQLVGEYLFAQRVNEDQRITEAFAQDVADSFGNADAGALYAAALDACQDGSNRVLILDENGIVQVDSQCSLNGSRFVNNEVALVLYGNQGKANGSYGVSSGKLLKLFRTLLSRQETLTGVSVSSIQSAGRTGAVVYITQMQEIYQSLTRIQLKILFWLLIVGIAVLLLCTILINSITRPIDSLKVGIDRMTSGDFSVRIKTKGRNEFTELAAAFNSMCERLESLDQTRNQFVSNASHELKTPLSTMKILIESVLYQNPMDPVMTKDFLSDVNKEIDRLNRIVTDLLTLANIDSGGMKLNTAQLDIRDMLEEQVRRLAPLARENGIDLDCITEASVQLIGDPVKLEQVIYNVIDNAIKYTPRGGRVTASLTATGHKAVIRVSDTGIGIPAKDLPHVFDRFYRVDKARSRATGGTGLGLSIVRQIVQKHGGTITAQSVEGKGTTFIIELPTE